VFRGAVLKQVPLFGEMHRFIPAWLVTVIPVRRIAELPVNPCATARRHVEVRDCGARCTCCSTCWSCISSCATTRVRGISSACSGSGDRRARRRGARWLAFVKFVLGEAIGGRPLLLIGVVCVLAAIQLVTTGVLREILLRMGGEQRPPPDVRGRSALRGSAGGLGGARTNE
jgi:hypothetical protein